MSVTRLIGWVVLNDRLIGWVVLNDSEQPMGDGRGAVIVFATYDEATKVPGQQQEDT